MLAALQAIMSVYPSSTRAPPNGIPMRLHQATTSYRTGQAQAICSGQVT